VPYSKPSQAKHRKLVLPTGMPLIVESDSEEEHGQAAVMNSPKPLPAVRMTPNMLCCCTYLYRDYFKRKETVT
jgi:hypothetical protein